MSFWRPLENENGLIEVSKEKADRDESLDESPWLRDG